MRITYILLGQGLAHGCVEMLATMPMDFIISTESLNNLPTLKFTQPVRGIVKATKLTQIHWFSRPTLAEYQKQLWSS